MKPELKQHIIDTLEFLRDSKPIQKLTLNEIELQQEHLIVRCTEFIELCLGDKEDDYGTMTEWWLYETDKNIYNGNSEGVFANLEKAGDFVDYILNEKDR